MPLLLLFNDRPWATTKKHEAHTNKPPSFTLPLHEARVLLVCDVLGTYVPCDVLPLKVLLVHGPYKQADDLPDLAAGPGPALAVDLLAGHEDLVRADDPACYLVSPPKASKTNVGSTLDRSKKNSSFDERPMSRYK